MQVPVIFHVYDFVVIGGGLSGIAAAVAAAREDIKTALICDRPCLGGNASREMLTPPVGAHYKDGSFIYHRETGLLEELLLENLYNNSQGNPVIWDLNLQTMVYNEPCLDLFLNLAIDDVDMNFQGDRILAVKGYSLESDDRHVFKSTFFADCSGDGIVGFASGAPFMRGVEKRSVFNEGLAPEESEKREMGCSLRFSLKETGRPVYFKKPDWVQHSFSSEDFKNNWIEKSLLNKDRYARYSIEWGGEFDTIAEIRHIKNGITSIIYAIWHYLKNDSLIRDKLLTWDLDWIGSIPGRRENRRFIGDHVLVQQDIDEQRPFEDSIAYGGWGFDDHPAKGFFEKKGSAVHFMHRGPYNIPMRCLYSSKIANLFFAGRNISVSHIALSSTRIMNTCFQLGEAAGVAAAICIKKNILPKAAVTPPAIKEIQEKLILSDHTIFDKQHISLKNQVQNISISASSTLNAPVLTRSAGTWVLAWDHIIMFPVVTGSLDFINLYLDIESGTNFHYLIRNGQKYLSTMPGDVLKQGTVFLQAGKNVRVTLATELPYLEKGWYFIELKANDNIALHYGVQAPVGLKTLKRHNQALESSFINAGNTKWEWDIIKDLKTEPCGLIEILPEQPVYSSENVLGAAVRPDFLPNLWISQETNFAQPQYLDFVLSKPENIERVDIVFDSSLDNPIIVFDSEYSSSGNGYEFNCVPSLVKHYRVSVKTIDTKDWRHVAEKTNNYQRLCRHRINTDNVISLRLSILSTNGWARAQVYGVRIFRKDLPGSTTVFGS
jgi:hypothetical protein